MTTKFIFTLLCLFFFFITTLAQNDKTCGNNDEGCAANLCQCTPAFQTCNTKKGNCVGRLCLGQCEVSAFSWLVIVESIIAVIIILILAVIGAYFLIKKLRGRRKYSLLN